MSHAILGSYFMQDSKAILVAQCILGSHAERGPWSFLEEKIGEILVGLVSLVNITT